MLLLLLLASFVLSLLAMMIRLTFDLRGGGVGVGIRGAGVFVGATEATVTPVTVTASLPEAFFVNALAFRAFAFFDGQIIAILTVTFAAFFFDLSMCSGRPCRSSSRLDKSTTSVGCMDQEGTLTAT